MRHPSSFSGSGFRGASTRRFDGPFARLFAPAPPQSLNLPRTSFEPAVEPSSQDMHLHTEHPASNLGLMMPEVVCQWPLSRPFPASEAHLQSPQFNDFVPASGDPFNHAGQSMETNLQPIRGNSYGLDLLDSGDQSRCPRSFQDPNVAGIIGPASEGYPPCVYQMDPSADLHSSPSLHATRNQPLKTEDNCEIEMPFQAINRPADGRNAFNLSNTVEPESETPAATRSTTPVGGDLPDRDKAMEDCCHEKEEPYAKLIYRALLEAPGHTMVLRDIYTWFMQNTDKGTKKETKGWQNSIRHNLSMNGAFQKVDQPPGEEAKKGFLWRLTESAIREGVKSTTRYRSKLPNKRVGRSTHLGPHRHASGGKGGYAARKSARLRRSERLKDSLNPDAIQQYSAFGPDPQTSPQPAQPPFFMQQHIPDAPDARSGPSSPYYMSPNLYAERHFPHGLPETTSTPSSMGHEPLRGIHEYWTEEFLQLIPCSPGESLFYDSQESGNEHLLRCPPDDHTLYSGSESGNEPMTPPPPPFEDGTHCDDGSSWILTEALI